MMSLEYFIWKVTQPHLNSRLRERTPSSHQTAGGGGLISSLLIALKSVIGREIRIARGRKELMALSDDMLKDIGLHRSEIGWAVSGTDCEETRKEVRARLRRREEPSRVPGEWRGRQAQDAQRHG